MNWWTRLLSLRKPKTPEGWLGHIQLSDVCWLSLAFNTRAYQDFLPNAQLEITTSNDLWRINWGIKGNDFRWDIWRKENYQHGEKISSQQAASGALFLFTHLLLKESLVKLQREASKTTMPGPTVMQLQEESRALNWVQTSLRVLRGALEQCKQDKNKLLTCEIYLGSRTEGALPLLRMICFNLDMTLGAREDGAFGLVVFDDKDQGNGATQRPVLEAPFRSLKGPLLDEFIQLTAQITQTAEARYH